MRTARYSKLISKGILLLVLLLGYSCRKDRSDWNPDSQGFNFSVDQDYILKNGKPFDVQGIVYVPGYPGFLPWDIEASTNLPTHLKASIRKDIRDIKAMGLNTIRLWGAPEYCYEAIKNVGGLHFIQTIWIDGEAPDFQNSQFKSQTKAYIRSIVDRIYRVYDDKEPPLVAILIGNELSQASIKATNQAHPNLNQYLGAHIQTDTSRNASEVFLAEMADYCRLYELQEYGRASLLAYANDIRTFDDIDAPFLDFIAHNAYSYAVPFYRPLTRPGSSSNRYFQGWVEEVKAKHPDIPLLITETGLSVSPKVRRMGPPNYGYGGNSEKDQSEGILANIEDLKTAKAPVAGYCIHEYLDAWWKFGYQDSFSQDSNDIEEWFGLVKLKDSADWYSTEFRPSYYSIQNR